MSAPLVGNLQLTLARSAASAAETKWKAHKPHCPKCSVAQRHRNPADMCPLGSKLYEDRNITARELETERKLASLPCSGQGVFDFGDGGTA